MERGGGDGHGRVVADKGRYLYFCLHFVFCISICIFKIMMVSMIASIDGEGGTMGTVEWSRIKAGGFWTDGMAQQCPLQC